MATVHVKTTVHPRNYRELCPRPRGTTVQLVPVPAMSPWGLSPLPRSNHGYRGVTVIPITVQLSTSYLSPFQSYLSLLFKFWMKNSHFSFSSPVGGLEVAYTVHLRFIGKCVVDFLWVLTKLFLIGVTAEALRANIKWKISVFEWTGSVWPKISATRGRPYQPRFLSELNESIFHKVQEFWQIISFCHNAHVWRMNTETDRQISIADHAVAW